MRAHAMIFSTLSLVLALMAIGGHGLPSDYTVEFKFGETEVQQGRKTPILYNPALSGLGPIRNLSVLLLRSSATDGVNQIDSSNTKKLLDIQSGICIYLESPSECTISSGVSEPTWPIKSRDDNVVYATFTTKPGFIGMSFKTLFFCFASKNVTGEYCRYYSSIFEITPLLGVDDQTTSYSTLPAAGPTNIGPGRTIQRGGHEKVKRDLEPPKAGDIMQVSEDTGPNFIELLGAVPTTVTEAPISTTSLPASTTIRSDATVTAPRSIVATVTATPTLTNAESSSQGGGGLSIAAKVGIALGALAFALILLILTLLFLRRKHAKRNQPEQVMLTHSMHTDSFSRNLITEKEDPTSSTAATPIDELRLPIQRQSALATYEPVPSAPYTGAAVAIPRRKPTAATMASTVSRGLSTTSGTSSSGARSPRSGEGFEQYHDVPIYGDARHVPQVFPGNTRSMQSPFLSEEGMTAEEVARLEEEERRIDAAIAEAERR